MYFFSEWTSDQFNISWKKISLKILWGRLYDVCIFLMYMYDTYLVLTKRKSAQTFDPCISKWIGKNPTIKYNVCNSQGEQRNTYRVDQQCCSGRYLTFHRWSLFSSILLNSKHSKYFHFSTFEILKPYQPGAWTLHFEISCFCGLLVNLLSLYCSTVLRFQRSKMFLA